jgi:hypothetical protein
MAREGGARGFLGGREVLLDGFRVPLISILHSFIFIFILFPFFSCYFLLLNVFYYIS